MKDFPYFRFYPAYFMLDTMSMTNEEVGIYTRNIAKGWMIGQTDVPWIADQIEYTNNLSKTRSESAMRRWSKPKENEALDANAMQMHNNSNADRYNKIDRYDKIDKEDKLMDPKQKKRNTVKQFIPPTLEEVVFFVDQHISDKEESFDLSSKFIAHYEVNDWLDKFDNPIRNWKQKLLNVWLKGKK